MSWPNSSMAFPKNPVTTRQTPRSCSIGNEWKRLPPPSSWTVRPWKSSGKGRPKTPFRFGETAYFQVRDVSLREGTCHDWKQRSWDLKLTPPLFVKCLWFHSNRLARGCLMFVLFFCPPKFNPIHCFRVPQMLFGWRRWRNKMLRGKSSSSRRHFWMTEFEGVFLVGKCWLTVVLL